MWSWQPEPEGRRGLESEELRWFKVSHHVNLKQQHLQHVRLSELAQAFVDVAGVQVVVPETVGGRERKETIQSKFYIVERCASAVWERLPGPLNGLCQISGHR